MYQLISDRETPSDSSRTGSTALQSLCTPRARWPQYGTEEIEAVVDVLRSGRVNSLVHGERSQAFERAFAVFCGANHAISVSNGTVALELALRALGVGPGDEVIVPARSFFASASCIVAVGAVPVFADVDPRSQTIDPNSVRARINGRTRAVICVHLAGWPCDMDELLAICLERGLWLVEDCAQAHGAQYRGRRVGSFGHAAAFSFCTDKIMSTGGEGGMLLLRDSQHWRVAWAYKDHGKNPDRYRAQAPGHAFRYLHDSFGSNFRMTEMQAAIGLVQLAKLPDWLARRKANARVLAELLSGHPAISVPDVPGHVDHAFYKFYLMVNVEMLEGGQDMCSIVAALLDRGVPASTGSCPDMSRERAFRRLYGASAGKFPVASEIGRRSLMLPVDHLLDAWDMQQMGTAVRAVIDRSMSDGRGSAR